MSICLTSILTLYTEEQKEGRDLFDGVLFPDSFTRQDLKERYTRDLFINAILWQSAELELLFPEPVALNYMMQQWSKQRYPIWWELVRTMEYEYDPIENYNRKETWTQKGGHDTRDLEVTDSSLKQTSDTDSSRDATGTESGTTTGHTSGSRSTNTTNNGTQDVTGKTTQDEHTVTETVASENSFNIRYAEEPTENPPIGTAQLWPSAGQHTDVQRDLTEGRTQNTVTSDTQTQTETTTGDSNGSSSNNTTEKETLDVDNTTNQTGQTGSLRDGERVYLDDYEGHMRGNIGVTTTQKLIAEQRETVQFDIVQYVVDDFQKYLCLQIY